MSSKNASVINITQHLNYHLFVITHNLHFDIVDNFFIELGIPIIRKQHCKGFL